MYYINTLWVLISLIFVVNFGICHKQCSQGQVSESQLLQLDLQCFIEKYNSDIHNGHKLQRTINQRLAGFKRMRQYLKMRNVKPIQTSPVVKWAQSQQQIFINFKLSHRQDSPPCSDISYSRFQINNVSNVTGKQSYSHKNNQSESENTSGFYFIGQCFFTNQKFLYSLKITFNASLTSLNIQKQGLGQYILIGVKDQKAIWIDPFQEVQRAAIWPELRVKFSHPMDIYFEMRQKRNQENQQKKPKKKKKRRPTKNNEKITEENQKNSDEEIKNNQGTTQTDSSQSTETDL